MRRSFQASIVLVVGLLGCRSSVGPELPEGPYSLSRLRQSGIDVTLSASMSAVAPGETVQLTVAARNSSSRRLQIGAGGGCGPPMDIVIGQPGSPSVSLLSELLGSHGAFTCELNEGHFVDPGETEVVRLTWRAPSQRGDFTAVGGLRGSEHQLHTLSAPVVIAVR